MASFLPLTFGNPAAALGFVGFVRFRPPSGATTVRATSADIRLSQEIIKPDVVDSRFDRTVYQLGPRIVEGSVAFPAIFGGEISDVVTELYNLAVQRDANGKLTETEIDVKYTANNAAFTYSRNIIDSFTYSVTQSDFVNITVAIIGADRSDEVFGPPDLNIDGQTNDTRRIITWADAFVRIFPGLGSVVDLSGEFIRSFECTIANNAERFYTLNGFLAPQDIAPTKRDVTGSLSLMGRIPQLADLAVNNETRCVEDAVIRFGYIAPQGCGGDFLRDLCNCVFEIEEIALTNDLLETTVNFHVLPSASTDFDPLDNAPASSTALPVCSK
jgi:hypothetical protein